jgi:phosphoribosylamine--glycine ligase
MKMKVLVVGSGGREHALVKQVKGSPFVEAVWCWPGNDGILADAQAVPVAPGSYLDLSKWAEESGVGLVVVGPEAELVAGVSDEMRRAQIPVFGPSRVASKLEGSKIYAKTFMREFGVPTARADVVTSVKETLVHALKYKPPYVLKADGLAAGKGVFICKDLTELERAAKELFQEKKLGVAGERALLEEFQPGQELSVLALTNGQSYELLPLCRDHKRLGEGDTGPNTGGMGVVGPIEIDPHVLEAIQKKVIEPTLRGFQERGYLYRGVIFVGVMLTANGPQVLEYNVRLGDPETQTILPLLDGDWADVLLEVAQGRLPRLRWKPLSSACLVLAAEGYPDHPVKGAVIEGLGQAASSTTGVGAKGIGPVQVLHAGTKHEGASYVTNGGRVINVVAQAPSLSQALEAAYARAESIQWKGRQMRRDIGR